MKARLTAYAEKRVFIFYFDCLLLDMVVFPGIVDGTG